MFSFGRESRDRDEGDGGAAKLEEVAAGLVDLAIHVDDSCG